MGLMSGTSVDGIDAALVELERRADESGGLRFDWTLRHFSCISWPTDMREAILRACRPAAPLQFITALNFRLGEAFAQAALQTAEEAGCERKAIDCIASHGQTIWHQPDLLAIAGMRVRGTMQLGELSVIAARTGCRVVGDFRTADMAVGGQGAPLVPFADFALFQSVTETRVIQNIGGIANATFLPAQGTLNDIVAFDTGPGNIVLDALTQRLSEGARLYDDGGEWAAQGEINTELLRPFAADPFFALPPPKSTGREQFGSVYAERFLQAALQLELCAEDILATATQLTAMTIVTAYDDWLQPRAAIDTIIVGGGGVRNRTLMRFLAEQAAPARLTTHADYGLPDDAKEAIAFAILAYETLHSRPSNVPSATGAAKAAILGKIVLPPPK